jgi:hypothetical protein
MCTIEYGMMLIMIKKQKEKEANKEKKREKKGITFVLYRLRSFET